VHRIGKTGRRHDQPPGLTHITMLTIPGKRFLYALTLFGYFGTLTLLTVWYSWLAPPVHFPRALLLIIMLVPLLFPLRGLLHGRKYTFAWSCFLALLYFIHGVMEAYSSEVTRHLGLVEVLCTTVWFLSAMAYVRKRDI
jgi:uncharacterized membrane protein